MAVYINSDNKDTIYPKPSDEIDPTLKNGTFVANRLKYYYHQYIAGNCGITPDDVIELELNRLFLAGKQPTAPYRDTLTRESNKTDEEQEAVSSRKAYHNINYNNLSSPMPKYWRKIEGLFLKQEHSIVANATNEKSSTDKLEQQIEKYVSLQFADLKQKIDSILGIQEMGGQVSKFMERDMDEIKMLSNLGEYKLGYEVAAEKILETTEKISDPKHIKRKIIADLICGSITGIREYIDSSGIIKWRYLNPADAIVPFNYNSHFNDMEYFLEQEHWTILQLKKEKIFDEDGLSVDLTEDKYRQLAQSFHKYNCPNKAFDLYNQHFPSTNTYGYDDYRIPVMYGAFVTTDTKYERKFKDKVGDTRIAEEKWGSTKKGAYAKSMDYIYEGRWINDSDLHFNTGKLNVVPRGEGGKVKLPAHIIKLDGTSIIDNAKPILNDYALLGYRLQNAWAKAVPSGHAYDWSSLEGITGSSNNKLTPFDIVRAHAQSGEFVFRSRIIDSDVKYPISKPIERIEGGVGWTVLQEFMTTEEMLDRKLVAVIGIPSIEQAGERTPVAVARMAVSSMTDILKPLYDIYVECKERASYNTVYRAQILIRKNKSSEKFYRENIGKHYVQYLKEAWEKSPMSFGVSFEALATDEEKQRILDWALRATQSGKNGKPILQGSEFVYLSRNINHPSGIKAFEILLRHREIQDEEKAQQIQKANVESQGGEIQKQIMLAKHMERIKEDAKGKVDLDKIVVKGDVDLRNDLTLEGNKQEAAAVMYGIEAARAEYDTQGQGQGGGGQTQPPPVPPVPPQIQQRQQ